MVSLLWRSKQIFRMDERQRLVVKGFTISFAIWLLILFFLVFVFLRDLSDERGETLSYEELFDVALDFKYFFAVLFVGVVGLMVLTGRRTMKEKTRPVEKDN